MATKANIVSAILAGTSITTLALSIVLVGNPRAQAGPVRKVGPWDAMKSVTAKTGGKAIMATYALEGGKPGYDVVVVKGSALMEVEVDGATGKVGDSETVTPEMEGKELTAELHKALGHKMAMPAEKSEKGEKPD